MNNETRWDRIHAAVLGVNLTLPSVHKPSSGQQHSIPQRYGQLRANWRLVYGGLPRLEMRWFAVFHPRRNGETP